MGRKTFESFPKPLPNRTHIVISRQKNYTPTGCIVVSNLENALEICPKNEEIFIIGGGNIYEQALEITDKVYLTEVKANIAGDTFFSKLSAENWTEISRISHQKDEKNEYDFDFVELMRK